LKRWAGLMSFFPQIDQRGREKSAQKLERQLPNIGNGRVGGRVQLKGRICSSHRMSLWKSAKNSYICEEFNDGETGDVHGKDIRRFGKGEGALRLQTLRTSENLTDEDEGRKKEEGVGGAVHNSLSFNATHASSHDDSIFWT